jgi:hypothetical protein
MGAADSEAEAAVKRVIINVLNSFSIGAIPRLVIQTPEGHASRKN